jgi:hypothetical protein
MPIPNGITDVHVRAAMDQLGPDKSLWPKRRLSTKYDVIHPDPQKRWRMPPKLVMSVAAGIATGEELAATKFHGGREVNQRLHALGFDIIDRKKP